VVAGLQLVASEEVGAAVFPGVTQLVSTATDGSKVVPAVGPDVSHDGRFVAFTQSNAVSPIWRKDRLTSGLVLVSQSSRGEAANGQSYSVSLSPNGRYAAFVSTATNLVSGDSNGLPDVFLRDIEAGVTTRASIRSDGAQPNGTSHQPALSADGRYVAFHSDATNLVPGLTTSGLQVYVKDMVTGSLTLASKSLTTGEPGDGNSSDASISGDGALLVFTSSATNLAPDPADPNVGAGDVFLFNRPSGAVTLLSDFQVDPETRVTSGSLAELSIDGTAITFVAGAGAPLLAYGSPTGGLSVLRNNGSLVIDPFDPAISADGNQIAFSSFTPLTPEAGSFASRQLYSFDRTASSVQLVTIGTDGQPGNGETGHLHGSFAMSGDGRSVTFQTAASNLVAGDDPSSVDVFVRGPAVVGPGTGTTTTTAATITTSSTSSTPTSSTTTSTSTTSSSTTTTTAPNAALKYVALGDSFSSGEGTFNYDPGTGGSGCHRGPAAWPRILDADHSEVILTSHVACTGATTVDLLAPTGRERIAQISRTPLPATNLVTLTIGGNDADFASLLIQCRYDDCSDAPRDPRFLARLRLLERMLEHAVYPWLSRAFPNARLVHVGYPRLTPRPGAQNLNCGWLTSSEQIAGVELADLINSTIRRSAEASRNVEYLDVTDIFDRHELCTSESWVNPIVVQDEGLRTEQGHPNFDGQVAYAEAVARELRLG
jgi:Tol biopolymer transport system component/lysophospholipase L1-like esterase